MPLNCVILDDYQHVAMDFADWSSLFPQVRVFALHAHIDDPQALVRAIAHCEIVVIMRERTPFSAHLLEKLPNLQLLVTSGMRNAAIDMAAASAHGVTVCGTTSGSSSPVELTWALILGLARHIVTENRSLQENGPWQQYVGVSLQGKTLGLLGLGKIGAQMAQVAQAFGMHVCAWSQHLSAARAATCGVQYMPSQAALLATSDIISIHLVLSERTRHVLDAVAFQQMKPGAMLINTSRAAIVDQHAMIAALQQKKIAAAGLDVFEVEPLPADHPLRTLPNVLATPHLGYVTDSNYRTYFCEAVENIHAWLHGAPLRLIDSQ